MLCLSPRGSGHSPYLLFLCFFLFFKDFIYLFMRDTEREAEGEAGSPEGLDPRTPGSQPDPKADAQSLSHPGALVPKFH